MVEGPPSASIAAGSQRSPATTPSVSPRRSLSRYEISRIGADSREHWADPPDRLEGHWGLNVQYTDLWTTD